MKRKNEIIMNDVQYSCWTNFAQNFIDWSMSQKKFKRFTRKGYGSPGRKFKEKFLWCVTIRKEWFSIEIYRGDRHWKKKNEKGDTKATAITASVLSVLPDVLFILVTMSAVTSVIVVTDLRPIVNHSLSSLSSTSSVL